MSRFQKLTNNYVYYNSMGESKGTLSAKELERYAKENGFSVVNSKGRTGHNRFLQAPNGTRRPIPTHGSRNGMGTGTVRSLLKFIEGNTGQS